MYNRDVRLRSLASCPIRLQPLMHLGIYVFSLLSVVAREARNKRNIATDPQTVNFRRKLRGKWLLSDQRTMRQFVPSRSISDSNKRICAFGWHICLDRD
jgi:hypothetical protein